MFVVEPEPGPRTPPAERPHHRHGPPRGPARTRRAVKEQALEQQYRLVAGDAFTDHLGGPYDLAIVANFCHLFGADANLRLLRRLRPCLAADGQVAIIDVGPGTGPPQSSCCTT